MRCRFWKECKLYDTNNPVCMKYAGMYYEDHTRPAGCYREQALKKFKRFKV